MIKLIRESMLCDVLITCVTENEINGLFEVLKSKGITPKACNETGLKLSYHDFGEINGAKVLCIRTKMGSLSPGASSSDVTQAITEVNPKYVVAVGIAYGVDVDKQKMGSVLISEKVQLIDPKKVLAEEDESKIEYRGSEIDISPEIFGKFRGSKQYWEGECEIHSGLMLSGETLINSLPFKLDLMKHFPDAIGGEMEAAGICSAISYNEDVKWIIIKAVCDHAVNKDHNKEENQKLAAKNAAEFLLHSLTVYSFKRVNSLQDPYLPSDTLKNKTDNSSKTSIDYSNNTVRNISGEPSEVPFDALHSKGLLKELEIIKKRRALPGANASEEILNLLDKINSGREYRYCAMEIRLDLYYWACYILLQNEKYKNSKILIEITEFLFNSDYSTSKKEIVKALLGSTLIQDLSEINDPDAHSLIFYKLANEQGYHKAIEWFESFEKPENDFFNAVGWKNLITGYASEVSWDKAVELSEKIPSDLKKECPDIFFIQGILYIGCLFPDSERCFLLNSMQFPLRELAGGEEATNHINKALTCLEAAAIECRGLDLKDRLSGCEYWMLNLKLATPSTRSMAELELEERVRSLENKLLFFPLVLKYKVDINLDSVKSYLKRKEILNSLSQEDKTIKFWLLHHESKHEELLSFSSLEKEDILTNLPPESIFSLRLKSLLELESFADAKKELKDNKDFLDPDEYARYKIKLAEEMGDNVELETLENLYKQTQSILDLQNLASFLEYHKQWNALLPKAELLLRKQVSTNNLLRLLKVLGQLQTPAEEILELITSHFNILEKGSEGYYHVLCIKAQALLFTEKFKEIDSIIREIPQSQKNGNWVLLELNLALRTGQWETLPVIVDREIFNIDKFSPQLILHMANLAANYSPERTMELLKALVEQEESFSSNAYFLASKVGLEKDAGLWLKTTLSMIETGKDESGQKLSIIEAKEMIISQSKNNNSYYEKFLNGDFPIHFMPHFMHTTIIHAIIGRALWNNDSDDARNQGLIPIRSGIKIRRESLPKLKTMCLDITSIYLLEELHLFDELIKKINTIYLSPRIMETLWSEADKARFHQPSRIKEAEDILKYIETGKIIELSKVDAPQYLIDEVGDEMAQLLSSAQDKEGKVIASLPIHKAGSLDENADIDPEYNQYLYKTTQLLDALSDDLEEEIAIKAKVFLTSVDKGEAINRDNESLLSNHLYVDNLALHYLYYAGVLKDILKTDCKVYLSSSAKEQYKNTLRSSDYSRKLIDFIETIRKKIRDQIRLGKICFLNQSNNNHSEINSIYLDSLQDIMTNISKVDAVSIDDRYLNKSINISDSHKNLKPLLDIIDLIEYLKPSKNKMYSLLNQLRKRGFTFIPTSSEEILYIIKKRIQSKPSKFTENDQLKNLRKNILLLRSEKLGFSSDMLNATAKLRSVGHQVLIDVWKDNDISVKLAGEISSWIIAVLGPSTVDHLNCSDNTFDVTTNQASYLVQLLLIGFLLKTKRKQGFGIWLEKSILSKYTNINSGVMNEVYSVFGRYISQIHSEVTDG